jgi:hypothetical protein
MIGVVRGGGSESHALTLRLLKFLNLSTHYEAQVCEQLLSSLYQSSSTSSSRSTSSDDGALIALAFASSSDLESIRFDKSRQRFRVVALSNDSNLRTTYLADCLRNRTATAAATTTIAAVQRRTTRYSSSCCRW